MEADPRERYLEPLKELCRARLGISFAEIVDCAAVTRTKKLIDTVAALEVVKQVSQRDARTDEHGSPS